MSTDLRRLLREASRATSRHRALLAAGLVAASVATALPSLAPTPAPGVAVLTAARDLPGGTSLAQGDLVHVRLPRALVPAGALLMDGAALGRLVAGPVRRGEPLTDVRLLGAGLLAGGRAGVQAVPLRLADAGSAVLIRPGDRVDVLAATTSAPSTAASVVATAVQVLAVPAAGGETDGALVVLATTPAVAARLAAAAVSSRLSVSVRAP